MEASPRPPGARKPETELGAVFTTAVPHPDSRSGPSPHLQGRVMDEQRTVFVGIDVSKDRLDVHLRPSGEAFCVPREGKEMDDLVIRLQGLSVALVVLEATGGFEAAVAAALAGENRRGQLQAKTLSLAAEERAVNHHQRKVLHAIFAHPVNANLDLKDVIGMLTALGAEMDAKTKSRIGITLNGRRRPSCT